MKLKITTSPPRNSGSLDLPVIIQQIWIDGEEVKDVSDLTLHLNANGLVEATMTRFVSDVEIEAEA